MGAKWFLGSETFKKHSLKFFYPLQKKTATFHFFQWRRHTAFEEFLWKISFSNRACQKSDKKRSEWSENHLRSCSKGFHSFLNSLDILKKYIAGLKVKNSRFFPAEFIFLEKNTQFWTAMFFERKQLLNGRKVILRIWNVQKTPLKRFRS